MINDFVRLDFQIKEILIFRMGPIFENGSIKATEISKKIGWDIFSDQHLDKFIYTNRCLYSIDQGDGQQLYRPLNFKFTRAWVIRNLPEMQKDRLFKVFDLMEKDHAVFFRFKFPEEKMTWHKRKGAEYKIVYWFCNKNKAVVAVISELSGCCMAVGHTEDEAIANARIVIDQWLQTAKESGREIPIPWLYL